MPRGDKSSYTGKQKRQAEHIEEGYEKRGVPVREAARRAWATVNKETHGGKKSGSGRGKAEDHSPSRKGGRLGGRASASRPARPARVRPRRLRRPASGVRRLSGSCPFELLAELGLGELQGLAPCRR
jgi:plasmid stabilization system protein ParE